MALELAGASCDEGGALRCPALAGARGRGCLAGALEGRVGGAVLVAGAKMVSVWALR